MRRSRILGNLCLPCSEIASLADGIMFVIWKMAGSLKKEPESRTEPPFCRETSQLSG